MSEEKAKKTGRTVALSGVIGFILAALLVGMVVGGAVALFVIAPYMQPSQQNNSIQGDNGNQNSNNYQNGNNNQGYTGNQNGNDQNGDNNQGNTNDQNSNQNDNNDHSIYNSNPAPTNPTGQYSSSGCQFAVTVSDNGAQASGSITANVNCVVQQDGNNIQLAVTLTPTMIPQSLIQMINNSPVTFNFAGTVTSSQVNAGATGSFGHDNTGPSFDFHLSGTIGSNTLTLTVNSNSDSQISISTSQPIILQSNA